MDDSFPTDEIIPRVEKIIASLDVMHFSNLIWQFPWKDAKCTIFMQKPRIKGDSCFGTCEFAEIFTLFLDVLETSERCKVIFQVIFLLPKVLLRVPTENSFVSVRWISVIIRNSSKRSHQLSFITGRKPVVSPSLGMF